MKLNRVPESIPKQRHRKMPKSQAESNIPEAHIEHQLESGAPITVGKDKIPIGSQIRAVLFGSWLNVLLLAVPVGFVLNFVHPVHGGMAIFWVNFVAIVPLAAMLGNATEELAHRVGDVGSALLNVTFGNAVELIVSIQALTKGEITVVKASLVGSMLSNLLLVMGMAFFLGGISREEQFFNPTSAQTSAGLLALFVGGTIVLAAFGDALPIQAIMHDGRSQKLSRAVAVILLTVYALCLVFQLKSHARLYNTPGQKATKRRAMKARNSAVSQAETGSEPGEWDAVEARDGDAETDKKEEPRLSLTSALLTLAVSTALLTLAVSTALVAFCSEFMVSSIEDVTSSGALSTTFVGLVLVPIVGNAAEHAAAVTLAIKDKMTLSTSIALGSSIQIAFFVLPLVVLVGWALDSNCMTLDLDAFEIAVLFVAVVLVNCLIPDGKCHWLKGILLMACYAVIAVAAGLYLPTTSDARCSN